ncbi:hypothetical protein W02_03270 [Nitrospira sp. KM1]|uniref:anti-sigma factor domain-containing protein n=1 Tax=Nitrospira sp. KM1 TaxID=1936990 RepID=UPI0013A76603|nr:anti-sigma factor [Nitrospira sp. KM1]BCA53187.1 hypothetical protein W02_03270 [Nitrospira sp. KM1]
MTHEELEESVPLYATGALDRSERQALEAHLLSGCPTCHGALKEYQSLAGLLPFGLTPTQPPRALKARIMAARNPAAAVPEETQKPQTKSSLEPGEWMNHLFPPVAPARSLSLPWAIGLASAAVLFVAGYAGWIYTTKVADDEAKLYQLEASLQEQSAKVARLQREVSEKEQALTVLQVEAEKQSNDIAELKQQAVQREADLEQAHTLLARGPSAGGRGSLPRDEFAALLRQPDVRVVSMAGSDKAKTASGIVLFDKPSQKMWLYAVNLPECENGMVYQVWAIDQSPKSVGIFHINSGDTAHLLMKKMPDFERAKRFAISLEPPGGRPQPSGALYLVSQH